MDVPDMNQQLAAKVGSQVTIDFGDGEPETFRLIDVQGSKSELSAAVLSTETPVGRAVLGHHAGETVTYRAPRGAGELRLLTVV